MDGKTKFFVFVDESGETGISRIRVDGSAGASPYFVMGAAVLPGVSTFQARQQLAAVRERIGKKSWTHATDLDHPAKVFFCREASRLNARFFAVISNKSTLSDYSFRIDWEPQKFYNKCLKYLLERVCKHLAAYCQSSDQVEVVIEDRNHDFDAMLRYLGKVKENPIYPESRALALLNPFSIVRRRKSEEDLLVYADIVAHSVYQLANKTDRNYGIPETRYFFELSRRFACNDKGEILGLGLKCIHDLQSLNLDAEVEQLVRRVRATPPHAQKQR